MDSAGKLSLMRIIEIREILWIADSCLLGLRSSDRPQFERLSFNVIPYTQWAFDESQRLKLPRKMFTKAF